MNKKPIHFINVLVFLCPWMDGIPQGAKEGGAVMFHGWTVFRKEPRKAVRLCSMDGISQGAKEGSAVIFKDNIAKTLKIPVFLLV